MKLLGLLRGRREEDQKDDENAVPTADSSSASKAPASASRCSSSIPLFFVLVGGTQLFFSLTHELMRDWKGRQLLPCHDAEPWRYLVGLSQLRLKNYKIMATTYSALSMGFFFS